MPFHKLADGPITMTIGAVRSAEGKFGPQMVFTSNDGTDVFISEMSGAKGLARLNLTEESVVGKTLHFEQIKKDGKTFTNINLSSAGAVAPATATTSTAAFAPKAAGMTQAEAVALYSWALDTANGTLGKLCELQGMPVDAAALQSAAATLFIAVKGR